MPRLRVQGWALVPGPSDFEEPLDSCNIREDLAEYKPRQVADVLLKIAGVRLLHDAMPTWWDWKAQWAGDSGIIEFGMTLLRDEPPLIFGGFDLKIDCELEDLMSVWLSLRRSFRAIWMHSPDCAVVKPSGFRSEVRNLLR